jgi:hypothetical protein
LFIVVVGTQIVMPTSSIISPIIVITFRVSLLLNFLVHITTTVLEGKTLGIVHARVEAMVTTEFGGTPRPDYAVLPRVVGWLLDPPKSSELG